MIPQLSYQINEAYVNVTVGTNENGRFYCSEGNGNTPVPSVTTLIGPYYDSPTLQKWKKNNVQLSKEILAEGNRLHQFAEDFVTNKPVEAQKRNDKGLKKVLESRLNGVYAAELGMAGELFGGRIDCLGLFDDVPSLIDFKTTLRLKERWMVEKYFVQGILYCMLLREAGMNPMPQQIVIILVEPNGNVDIQKCSSTDRVYTKKAMEVFETFNSRKATV